MTNQGFEAVLCWHATCKMRLGRFDEAASLFAYLLDAHYHEMPKHHVFPVNLALAYCHYRDRQLDKAREVLKRLDPPLSRHEVQTYQRLAKRVGGV